MFAEQLVSGSNHQPVPRKMRKTKQKRNERKIIMMKAVVRSNSHEHHGAVSYGPFAKAVNTDCGIMCDLVARRTPRNRTQIPKKGESKSPRRNGPWEM